MNTSGINNLQNQYALYSGTTSNTTSSTSTSSTTQSTASSTADTVTLSAEALALQATSETDTVNPPESETLGVGQGHGIRPPQ
ncbi:hypothetical protein [Rheinheimera sp.]|uniref:hypothetical protein n=1 Tax=Rheinheimera sp. TaxID=1869214 RepID=UPI002FDCD60A